MIQKDREPFSVRPKLFWEVTQAKALLAPKFAKSLAHEPDGLIFQPSLDVSVVYIFYYSKEDIFQHDKYDSFLR